MQWDSAAAQVIKDITENKNTKYRASIQLGVSVRTIERRVAKFMEKGQECFIHGNTGNQPANKRDLEKIASIIEENSLDGANFREISRILNTYFHITISDSTLRRYYYGKGVLSPKCKRSTRRAMVKKLKQQQKDSKLSLESAVTLSALKQEEQLSYWKHPTKPRSAMFGQRIEMDASSYHWIKGMGKMTLHVAIDDATGYLVGLWLEEEETLHGYYQLLEQILSQHGIPLEIRTDKRTVFTYNHKGKANPEKDTMTQFAYACSKLGIGLQCNSDPDFKPKVERANQTLQGILPFRFGMEGITTAQEANTYLKEVFIPLFNAEFGYTYDIVKGNKQYVKSAFIDCSQEQIRTNLVVLSERVINQGTTISVDKQYYELHNEHGKRVAIAPKSRVTLARVLDGTLYAISPKGQWFFTHPVPTRYEHNPDAIVEPVKKPKTPHTPAPGHPWSYKSQMKFRESDALMKKLKPLYTDYPEHRLT
ncbi:MAG: ISNCY family transposase [Spirochaetia bacterium]|nr:ISNCY family transposase [Spirochaetia bacterium]